MYEHILILIDTSIHSRTAVVRGVELAQAFGSRLHLAFVLNDARRYLETYQGDELDTIEDRESLAAHLGWEILEEALAAASLARVQANARLVYGDPLKDIGASGQPYDLILIAKPKHPELALHLLEKFQVPVILVCAERSTSAVHRQNEPISSTRLIS
ncbi:universal stress protein [Meiothermus sp.]|uniref:universal stress protein n=1 Tax=Meiothermus sp. TaxID=1955249 RepID=UPI00307D0233